MDDHVTKVILTVPYIVRVPLTVVMVALVAIGIINLIRWAIHIILP